MSTCHEKLKQYPSAIKFARLFLGEKDVDLESAGMMMKSLVQLFELVGNYNGMIEYCDKALELYKQLPGENENEQVYFLVNKGNSHSYILDQELTLEQKGYHSKQMVLCFQKIVAIELTRKENKVERVIKAHMDLARTYEDIQKFDQSLLEARQARVLSLLDGESNAQLHEETKKFIMGLPYNQDTKRAVLRQNSPKNVHKLLKYQARLNLEIVPVKKRIDSTNNECKLNELQNNDMCKGIF